MSHPVVILDSDSDAELEVESSANKFSKWKTFLVPMGFNEDRVTEAANHFDFMQDAFHWLMETDEAAVGMKLASSTVPSETVVQIDVDDDDGDRAGVDASSPHVVHSTGVSTNTSAAAYWNQSWTSAGVATVSGDGKTSGASTASAQTGGVPSRSVAIEAVDLTGDCTPPSPSPSLILPSKRRHARANSPGKLGALLSAGINGEYGDVVAASSPSSSRHKTSFLLCQVCEMSVASTSVFTIGTCHHRACVPCLRRHVEARVDLAESIERHNISWPNSYTSSNPSSLATSPIQLPGIATTLRRLSSPVTRRSSKVAAEAASSESPLSQALIDPPESLSCVPSSFLVLTPLDCPVEDCGTPLPWSCLEDLTGSARWQEFTGGCMDRYQLLTSAVDQSRSVWVHCPGCHQKLMVDAETIKLPDGGEVSKLTATDIKAELLIRGLLRSGSRVALMERLQCALKREAECMSSDGPPMLRCQNPFCTSLACVLCGHVEPGIPHAPRGHGRSNSTGSKDKSKGIACQSHSNCPRKGLYQAVTMCKRLNTVLHLDTSLDVTSRKKKKGQPSNSGGIGYSGAQSEKAAGCGREVEEAQEREIKADRQYMKMIQNLNGQLQTFAQNMQDLCELARASSSATSAADSAIDSTTASGGRAAATAQGSNRQEDMATSPLPASSSRESPVIVSSSSSSSSDRRKVHATAAASSSMVLDLSAVRSGLGSPSASASSSSSSRQLLTNSLLSSGDDAGGGAVGGAVPLCSDVPHPLLHTAIRRDLLPALLLYLRNDSIIDVAKRPAVYSELFDLLCTMLNDSNLLWVLDESFKDDDGYERHSVLALLQRLHMQARVFLKTGAADSNTTQPSDDIPAATGKKSKPRKKRPPSPPPITGAFESLKHRLAAAKNSLDRGGDGGNEADGTSATYTIAKRIDEVCTQIQDTLATARRGRVAQANMLRKREVINLTGNGDSPPRAKRLRPDLTPSLSGGRSAAGASATAQACTAQQLQKQKADAESSRLEQEYIEAMEQYRFRLADVYTASHCYYTMAKSQATAAPPRKRMLRIRQELASLSTSLPIEYRSSIFLCVDENRVDVMKALVVGPEDTPYANGLFEFDIFLPTHYPNLPPNCKLTTTNLGQVRFNPNLYACGKVCLSLLGTWQGPSWDSSQSTLLQVLVSIQAMILVPDPFFNEPGFDTSRNTAGGKWSSENYNARVREATVRYAMTKHITSPNPLFAKVIREHFRLKADVIAKQLDDWMCRAVMPPKPSGAISCEGGMNTSEASMRNAVLNLNAQLSQLKPIEL